VGHGIAPLRARATTIPIMMRNNANILKVPSRAQEYCGGLSEEPKTEEMKKQKIEEMTKQMTEEMMKTTFNERKMGNSKHQ
jgi:pyruvoyl-dependent arginine decarboxylase (PvlArgDC)